MELPTYFTDFLDNIRPTQTQKEKMKAEHKLLRERLMDDQDLSPHIVSTFIQGSYRRFTATQPLDGGACDVDVVVVTSMHESGYSPTEALETFRPFLMKHYKGIYHQQGRSWLINVDPEVTLDLVPTSAPSATQQQVFGSTKAYTWDFPNELQTSYSCSDYDIAFFRNATEDERFAEFVADADWQSEPLRIPDREAESWDDTHPLEQIRWTWNKSSNTNRHYVNVVKSLKWWRKVTAPIPKYPKSYPLEHLIGDCCPDGIESVAQGVTLTLEKMVASFEPLTNMRLKPHLADRGVPHHDVLARVDFDDFADFIDHVSGAAMTARAALDATTLNESARLWRSLFGEKFPAPPSDDDGEANTGGGFTPRKEKTIIGGGRFA